MKTDMKTDISLYQFLRQWLFLKGKSIQLLFAIKLCDLKQRAFNRRYFVILDSGDRLISLSRGDVNRLKRLRRIQRGVSHLDLMEKAFYYTPLSRNDNVRISKEERKRRKDTYMRYVRLRNGIPI